MTQSQPIRVIIVDDHAMLRKGLRFFLTSYDDLELVGEASSGREAIQICGQLAPDVVVQSQQIAHRIAIFRPTKPPDHHAAGNT